MKIVCIGDSLTFGYGIKKDCNWTSLLASNPKLNIINKGVNGDTTVGLLSRFFKDVVNFLPDICIIMCGSNDLLMNREVSTVFENICLMIKDCTNNNIIPIVISPPKILDKLATLLWSNNINYDIVNAGLQSLDKVLLDFCTNNNINFISFYNTLPLESIYYTDGLHISNYGNKFLYELIKRKLA